MAAAAAAWGAMPTAKSAKSPSSVARAPWPSGARPTAPPRWRSSTESSGVSGPLTATRASMASPGMTSSSAPSPTPGTAWGGSMCSRSRSAGVAGANVSIAGPSARSGASSSDADASSPR